MIAQIETDKVTIDVRAPTAGVITDLMVSCMRGVSCPGYRACLLNFARRSPAFGTTEPVAPCAWLQRARD